jgi:hypothetical protein
MSSELISKAADILNVYAPGIVITDYDIANNLALVSFGKGSNIAILGDIRGYILDINRGLKICSASPWMPISTTQKISKPEGGYMRIVDEFSQVHMIPEDSIVMNKGLEGVIIRTFKYAGRIFKSSLRRIYLKGSKWGDSDTFANLYDKVGYKDDFLFNPSCNYSPWCYTWVITDPKLLVGSKEPIRDTYITLISYEKMWDYNELELSKEEVGEYENSPNFDIDELLIDNISRKEANSFIDKGYYPEIDLSNVVPELRLGEFITLSYEKPNGKKEKLRVESIGYQWRVNMRHNYPSIKSAYYYRLSQRNRRITNGDEFTSFKDTFPLGTDRAMKSLLEDVERDEVAYIDDTINNPEEVSNSPVDYIWTDFIASVPVIRQKEAFNLRDIAEKGEKKLINRLYSIINNNPNTESIDCLGFSDSICYTIKRIIDINIHKKGYEYPVSKGDIRRYISSLLGMELKKLIESPGIL